MKGSYDVRIENARVQFKLTLNRNLTLIRGRSASGKTTLVSMVAQYARDGQASGITLSSPRPCVVLEGSEWAERLHRVAGSFVFIDEGNAFLRTEEFARAVKESDNYYVIVSREDFPMLPYSVEEVYEIKNTTSRYPGVRKYYAHAKRMYSAVPDVEEPQVVIVEDSNAGFTFFEELCRRSGAKCVSAGGKGNVLRELRRCQADRILIVADGAAFGPHMEMVLAQARRKGAGLFLPESFEWLVLKSGIVKEGRIGDILADPASFIESSEFFSWERFFDAVLTEETRGTYLRYSKNKLNPANLQQREFDAITSLLDATGLVSPSKS